MKLGKLPISLIISTLKSIGCTECITPSYSVYSLSGGCHIVYIPDDIEELEDCEDGFYDADIELLMGYVKIIGGKGLKSVKNLLEHSSASHLDI